MTRHSFRNPPVWLLASALMAVLLPAILLNNDHFLFRHGLYEFEDLAADSLQILKAKSFHEIHGQYSRWGFHHLGPAFFYVQAWGELLFYDWCRLVPLLLNAQMLASVSLNVFFISIALATAARWIGTRTVFLPLALGLAVLHLADISFYGPEFAPLFLIGNWPACFLVVPFAALLLALASVSAGRGESLPFAVLIGCFLVHGHVAQAAVFVPPLSAMAYAGLLLSTRTGTVPPAADQPPSPSWRTFWTGPWRKFPRAHLLTLVILAIFVLPILIDLSHGGQSNIARILAYRRANTGEPHKTLARSLLYFLQFGAYQWFRVKTSSFGDYTPGEIWLYLKKTRMVWEFWVVGMLGALSVMASWLLRGKVVVQEPPEPTDAATQARRRYIVHLALYTGAAVALTLVWGCIMTGEMFYLNAYFNFGIFYVGMLVLAATATDFLCVVTPPGWTGRGLRVFLYAAVALLAVLNADCLRERHYAQDESLATIAGNVTAALRADSSMAPRTRFLTFYPANNALAVDVAMLLERSGHPFFAEKTWEIVLGEDRCPAEPIPPGSAANGKLPFLCWRIVPASDVPAGTPTQPLIGPYVLMTGRETIDPAAGSQIRFGGPDGNDVAYTTFGWPEPERTGAPYRLSGAKESMLSFRALAGTGGKFRPCGFRDGPFPPAGEKTVPADRHQLQRHGTRHVAASDRRPPRSNRPGGGMERAGRCLAVAAFSRCGHTRQPRVQY